MPDGPPQLVVMKVKAKKRTALAEEEPHQNLIAFISYLHWLGRARPESQNTIGEDGLRD
jgi:hypothetical protein